MFRPASRLIARSTVVRALPRVSAPTRRFLSTAPPTQKSRTWKSLVARLGIAGAIIYYYNTTDLFAEEPSHPVQALPQTEEETEQLPTIEVLAKERRQRKAKVAAAAEERKADEVAQETAVAGGVEGLEEEADQQGAFNPETGEINWDCPCLGGMADGPCGEEFKAAFSCFVFSTEEPKGMDCIDKFKNMQNCFRQYPEIYGSELETDDEDDVTADQDQPGLANANNPSSAAPDTNTSTTADSPQKAQDTEHEDPARVTNRAEAINQPVKEVREPLREADSIVPKAAHDQRDANEETK